MAAGWNPAGNLSPFATSTVSKVSAPYQTQGNGNTAKIIRKLIGQPQHSYVLQDAPRQYIRSVREAAISGSYRRGLERSTSRDELNWHHIESMHSLLGSMRETGAAEDGGFILVHLNSLVREHSKYLGSERFGQLEWTAKLRPETVEAEETAAPEREEEAVSAGEENRTVFTQLLKKSEPVESEPVREAAEARPPETAPATQTPAAQQAAQTPAAQANTVVSLGLK